MTPDVQTGQIVFGRFRLNESLAPDLWRVEDTETGGTPLLAFLASDQVEATRDRLFKLREVQHAAFARIYDVYIEDALAAVSLADVQGELLSQQIAHAGSLPYRSVLDAVEPVVAAVQAIHQAGLIHGELSLDRILMDEDHQPVLLPPLAPAGAQSDIQQLGLLLRGALSGKRAVDPDRELNDMPDLLHEGRTLPALLNQLVADLTASQASQRPAGTGEVLNRLMQIENVVAEPADVPVIADPIPAPPEPVVTKSGDWIKWVVGFGILIMLGLVIGGIGFGFMFFKNLTADAQAEAMKEMQALEAAEKAAKEAATMVEAPPGVDLVQLALEKAEAEEALDKYLVAKNDAESVGAHRWAEKRFTDQMRGAAIADKAYLDKDYPKAAEKYLEVAHGLERLKEGKEQALLELLLQGEQELKTGTTATAMRVFETALLIDSTNAEGQRGLTRARTLDELNRLLTKAEIREKEKQMAFAHTDYAEAVGLDPLSPEARKGLERVKTAIAEEKFQTMMSGGLAAFESGDYDRAQVKLQEAKDFRPDRKEVDDALAMVAEGIRLRTMKELQAEAAEAETAEDWQAARKAYLKVLEIDENIEFAKTGKKRAEDRMTLTTHIAHYLERPHLLTTSEGREAVRLVIADAEEIKVLGPELKKAYAELNKQVERANRKVKVTLTSDGLTEVTVFKVRKYGSFDSKMLELLPGTYTILGQRDGYRDVRHTLKLEPGKTASTRLNVICTERF